MNNARRSNWAVFSIFVFIAIAFGWIFCGCNKPQIPTTTIIEESWVYQPQPQINIEHNTKAFLEYFNRKWSQGMIKEFVKILEIGEQETGVSALFVLYIMGIESEFNIKAKRINSDNSIDFGLSQQNSRYIKDRYKAASSLLDKRKIKYNINNKYDYKLNTIAAFMYIKDITKHPRIKTKDDTIGAYNVGIRGLDLKHKEKQKNAYIDRFYALIQDKNLNTL